jgi:mannosyltransferase
MFLPKGITRILLFSILFIITFIIFNYNETSIKSISLNKNNSINNNIDNDIINKLKFSHHIEKDRDDVINDNYKSLQSILNQRIFEPKVNNLIYSNNNNDDNDDNNDNNDHNNNDNNYQLANATLMILAKNSDLKGVIHTMKQIEKKFNSKFNYPYVFLNDGNFNQLFKDKIKQLTNSKIYFEKIDPKIWNQPNWIDENLQNTNMKILKDQNIAYANKISYHNMCRFYSKNFYNHPRMKQFKYYWRFEPNTDYFCDINYDIFKFMELNNKIYGFTIALYDAHETIKSLWTTTLNFLKLNPSYLNSNAAIDFLTEDLQNPEKTKFTNGYSTCHFWSNFEIADMDFYRSKQYSDWIDYLENSGGFYYERWGDAPVHTLGVSLFADKNDIHWFRDIGYKHHPYINCPNSDQCSGCIIGDFTYDHLKDQNCITNWWNFEMDDNARNLY